MPGPDVGVFLPTMSRPGELPGDIAAAARHAEDLGLESVWAVDQLIAGTGTPLTDSTVALSAAAGVTTRVSLGFGVMILPLHPVIWAAKQVASLQNVSGGRVILGVGAGGDRHQASWAAAGVPRRERGRRTDAALRVLPGLIAGQPTRLDDQPDGPVVQLAPPAAVPPILVGGMSDAALVRAAEHGDGWFAMTAGGLPERIARLAELAAERNRPTPQVTASMLTALKGDSALPGEHTLARQLADVDGPFGIPAEYVRDTLVIGTTGEVAAQLADAARWGARRVVVSFAGGDWHRQAELLADARALLGLTTPGTAWWLPTQATNQQADA
jgi:alkanesulfonate monooxygenase SsuD/methylene tetrahydromethanopterin reductase-like flavin-dependent oxidoreductase (luciferase family)